MSRVAIDFIHGVGFEDLPAAVVSQTKRCLLDLAGVAAAGSATPLSSVIRDHAAEQFGAGGRPARLYYDGRAVSPAGAALANGVSIDSVDAHDGHPLTKGHIGCGALPALSAFAEAEGVASGRAFLAALAMAYEVGARAGIALHRTATDYHTSGAWVALACAALGARLMRLDREATRHALGAAEYHGPRSQMMRCIDHPTMLKDGSGWGAMAGVSAAYLARSGFTGAPALTLEAEEVADLWLDLGARWRTLEQYFKPYPVCRWAQPAAEAALSLARTHGLSHGDVAQIEIITFHEATRLACRRPANTEEAQYSLPFPVAAALRFGALAPEHVSGAALSDPEALRLSDSMVLTESAEHNAAFPAERRAEAVLRLHDGRALRSGATSARGDAAEPLSDREISKKFHAYAAPRLGAGRAARLEAMILELDASGASVERLLAEFAAAP